jgi:transcriptional regulator with XRE-family HTH domain
MVKYFRISPVTAGEAEVPMTAQSKSFPATQFLIDRFADWLKHRRELNELRQMDRADFDRIAEDLRVSPVELDGLVRRGPHAADELPAMLRALGIDANKLARTEPMLLRDMERVCAMCNQKSQCDRDLIAGTAAEHYEGYCLNAPTIDRLDKTATK